MSTTSLERAAQRGHTGIETVRTDTGTESLRGLGVLDAMVRATRQAEPLGKILEIVADELRCGAALRDGNDLLAERYAVGPGTIDNGDSVQLIVEIDESAVLLASRPAEPWTDLDKRVLLFARGVLAMELSRQRSVRATELRLAGDLIYQLENARLDDQQIAERIAAFGFTPSTMFTAFVADPAAAGCDWLRSLVSSQLDRDGFGGHISAPPDDDVVKFLVATADHERLVRMAERLVADGSVARVAVGRSARGGALSRSLLEARAVLATTVARVGTYRDLGPTEVLLSVPQRLLEAYVERVLGTVSPDDQLLDSVRALLDRGMSWKAAAYELQIHRHTLRDRIDRFAERTGRHPVDPAARLELWVAVRALEALDLMDNGNGAARDDV